MTELLLAVVDDDDGVRDSLRVLLETRGYSVREFRSGEQFLARAPEFSFDCVLLDVRLPDMSGLDILGQLQYRGLQTAVIVMTGYGDVALAVAAMKAGARDFIEKPFTSDQIVRAVEDCFQGGEREHQPDAGIPPANLQVLTPREREVLQLLVEGLQNKMVARRLNISPRTAEVHRANIMRKLEASSFSHLIRMALASDL